jgi:aminoglycoside phosphotransferase (APT) family kinase protein
MSGSVVCKIVVDDTPYVLRVVTQRSPMHDPARQLACMRTAAEISVSPALVYADADRGVSISAFIAPPNHATGVPAPRDAAELGSLLRRLHHGPTFPEFLDAFQMIEGGLAELTRAAVVLPALVRELLEQYDVAKQVLAPHVTYVPCHNDLNPGNVLFDGERQWLIDWDAGCMGDPLFDVAGAMHWFALDESRRETMLRAYYAGEPTPHDRAKLIVMEQVSWTFYTLVFLLISRGPDGVGDLDVIERGTLPTFNEALGMISRGELRLHESEGRRFLALVMAKQALAEMGTTNYGRALRELRELRTAL